MAISGKVSGAKSSRSPARRSLRGAIRSAVESLERRMMLAAVKWDGGGDGVDWTDPLNWSANTIPSSTDSVVIGATGSPARGAIVSITPGLATAIRVNSLSIDSKSRLDVGDATLLIDYSGTSPLDAISGLIRAGRNGGGWDGLGIVSTRVSGNYTTIGIAEAAAVLGISGNDIAALGNQTIDASSIVVKYTYGGDATLDGRINIDDYVRIDNGVASGLSGWSNGDFNYDGKINVDDYTTVIDANVGTQGLPLTTGGDATTAASGNVFAQFENSIAAPGGTRQITITPGTSNFTLAGGTTIMGFQVRAVSAALNPAAVQIRDGSNNLITPKFSNANSAPGQSLTVAELSAGTYTVTVGAENGTSGDFDLDVYLVGDVDGDRTVTSADSTLLRNAFGKQVGQPGYLLAADANLDGIITSFDQSMLTRNVGDHTTLNPLTLNAGVAPNPTHTLPTGMPITNRADIAISGTATRGVTVAVDQDNDGFDDGSAPASPSNGAYSVALHLADGAYPLRARVADTFGQERVVSVPLAVDTVAPATPTFHLDSTYDTAPLGDKTTTFRSIALVGSTEGDVSVTVTNGPTLRTPADGTFRLAGVLLDAGVNNVTVSATDYAGNVSTASEMLTRLVPNDSAQVALEWTQAMLDAVRIGGSNPTFASRNMAMVSAAMYDAINSVNGASSFLMARVVSPAGASAEAAAAQAAHDVLVSLYADQAGSFDTLLATSLGRIPNGTPKDDGKNVGSDVATIILALRANDGAYNYVDYVPSTDPGLWQPTYPMYAPALDPQWATLQPFAMSTPNQFRPPGPPELGSDKWTADYNQVKSLGRATGSTRTADQAQIARFWADGGGTYTPPGHWNQIAAQVASAQGLSLFDTARLMAQLNVAMADAAIVTWDAKYAYDFWRPITAINDGALDGNPATAPDASWTPLIVTPPFPEYVSGHSTFSAAAQRILENKFGTNVSFNATSYGLPGVTRTYSSFAAAANEAGMSRIYGGIHYQSSVDDGLVAGRAVGDLVLAKFADLADTQAPVISIDNTPNAAVNAIEPITGKVIDGLSEVVTLKAQVDSGSLSAVSFDADGNFSFTPTLAADGAHIVRFQATDSAGNISSFVAYTFTLDRVDPTIAVTAPTANGNLAPLDHLTGSSSGTGSSIASFSYSIDGETAVPITVDATGQFDSTLNLGALDFSPGVHTLTLKVQDAAGNTATRDVDFHLTARLPLTVTSFTPEDGAQDVGSTYRPKLTFSRPVRFSSLTSSTFFARGPDGKKISARIVPSNDDTYAWLFFDHPLPGGSTITVTVKGSSITSFDNAPLDAANTGTTSGSTLTFSFRTVSLAALPGTSLSGIVADPGPDQKPGTFDDVRAGPDSVLMTADDVYQLPIAGATVSIAGTNLSVVTGADGKFSFPSAPAGDVKLVIDGNTATNAPAGMYFPEMVMDLNLLPGQANTVMSAMLSAGTTGAPLGAAATAAPGVYLPRLQQGLLQTFDDEEGDPMTIGVDPTTSRDLTQQQRDALSLTIQPYSRVDANGNYVDYSKIGISTVPADLVREMLPPGLLQHTFDITIQAPGVASFTTPIEMSFPNVFNAAPGTKLDFLSFDHTTGRLVIEGTATVSADGLSVVTDPGQGITHPGWHGLTPPGGCGGSGGPPPTPKPTEAADPTINHDPVVLPTVYGPGGDTVIPRLDFKAPPPDIPTTTPPPPNPNNCNTPARLPDQKGYLTVQITVDGPADAFLDASDGNLPLTTQTFTLMAGSDEKKTLTADAKSYSDMFGDTELRGLDGDRFYGATIKIKTIRGFADGGKVIDNYTYYTTRLIDAADDLDADKIVSFADTQIGSPRIVPMTVLAPADMTFQADAPYTISSNGTNFTFTPVGNGRVVGLLGVKVGIEFVSIVNLAGTGQQPQEWYFDVDAMKATVKAMFPAMSQTAKQIFGIFGLILDPNDPNGGGSEYFYDDAQTTDVINQVLARMQTKFQPYGSAIQRTMTPSSTAVSLTRFTTPDNPPDDVNAWGWAPDAEIATSAGTAAISAKALGNMTDDYSVPAQNFLIAKALNPTPGGRVEMFLDRWLASNKWGTEDFVREFANAVCHEIGHQLGLAHTGKFGGFDLMNNSVNDLDSVGFEITNPAVQVALGTPWTSDTAQKAIAYYKKYWDLGGGISSVPLGDDGSSPRPTPVNGGLLDAFTPDGVSPGTRVDFGSVTTGGSGGTRAINLINLGDQPLTLGAATFIGGQGQFALSGIAPGQILAPGQSAPLTITFAAKQFGDSTGMLRIANSGLGDRPLEIRLSARGLAPAGRAVVTALNNNLGGVRTGLTGSVSNVATLTNWGATPLHITGVALTRGAPNFAITGVPSDLASNPITVATGQTFTFGASFLAGDLGLARASIDVTTDAPSQPVIHLGAVATGISALPTVAWGNDFVSVTTGRNAVSNTTRVRSDVGGNFGMFLPSNSTYQISVFDPETGLVSHASGTTAATGFGSDLTSCLVFNASTAIDSDFDGLPDDIESTIGTATTAADTDFDAIDDFVEIQQNLDPFGGQVFATGVVASVSLAGEAHEVVLEGSRTDSAGQLAYVATGSGGLAIVDASKFQKPIVLSQLHLSGNALDVSVDSNLAIAAVAADTGGLSLIDVSDATTPKLTQTIKGTFSQVEVVDGIGYATAGTNLLAIDLETGETLQTLPLGTTPASGMAREGSFLYTLDSTSLRVIDLSSGSMVARGFISVGNPQGGKLFVANGIAYAGAGFGFGFSTVNVQDPNFPTLISAPDNTGATGITGAEVVANGSGLAIGVGQLGAVIGQEVLHVLDVSDPASTAILVAQFTLPQQPFGVALGGGIAYVADGTGGLVVANYLPFDTQGQPPSVGISTDLTDLDPSTPGIQVLNGTTLHITPVVSDDVQVRNVEMLINGQVVRNDVSFPYDMSAIAATNSTAQVQVRVTDTGGNVALSNTVTFSFVPDTIPPTVAALSPADGSTGRPGLKRITARFSEPMDPATLIAGNFTLVSAGDDGKFGTGDDSSIPFALQSRNDDRIVQLTFAGLPNGIYRLTLDAAHLTDRAGNPLGAQNITDTFTLHLDNDPPFTVVGKTPGFGTGATPISMAVADVDGDGNLDWITANQGDATVSVLFNDGDGAAQGGRLDFSVAGGVASLAVGDIDGDGDPDIVTANGGSNSVTVLRNDGLGNFSNRTDLTAGNDPVGVALGNVDGDSDLDLVVSNYLGHTVSVFRNNGSGTFGSRVDFGGFNHPGFITLVNVDGDSDLDFAVTESGGTGSVPIRLNNGAGDFSAGGSAPGTGSHPNSVTMADIDGDNDKDMIVGVDGGVFLARNNGILGSFSPIGTLITDGVVTSVACGDVDGDGDQDIVAGSNTFNHVAVFYNDGKGNFPTRRDYDAGGPMFSLALADLNGDGKLDLSAATHPGTLWVRLNDGAGGFGEQLVTTAERPEAVALGQLNGDNNLDIVTANSNTNTVSITLGAGNGAYQQRVDVAVGNTPQSVVLADIDGDTDLDIITANNGGNNISILRNNGAGTFGSRADVAVATSPQQIVAGDFDGDLDIDLATVNDANGNVTILLNNGTGTFTRADYAGVASNAFIAIGDVNGDHRPDVVTAAPVFASQTMALLINNGSGGFAAPALFDGGGNEGVALTDVDGDTDLDLIAVTFAQGGGLLEIKNDGTGQFASLAATGKKFYTMYGQSIGPITVGDFDGDSDPDIAMGHYFDSDVSIVKNDGSGGFGTPTADPAVFTAQYIEYAVDSGTLGAGIVGLASGDIDGDGDLDIAAAAQRDRLVGILKNDGTGVFGPGQFPAGYEPDNLALGDVNGDGILDAVTAGYGSPTDAVDVLFGDGHGGFGPRQILPGGVGTHTAALGDIDGDGDLDIVASGYDGNGIPSALGTILVFRNDGSGHFGPAETIFVGSFLHPLNMTLGDVNLDGNLDIVIANNALGTGNDSIGVFLGDGGGGFVFTANYRPSGADGPSSLALGDLNGDHAPDLAFVNEGNGKVYVMLNDGDGNFGTASQFTVVNSPRVVQLGDFDGDGDLDMAVTGINNSAISVLLNNGAGSFGAKHDYAAGGSPWALAVADVDRDGDLDLITGSFTTGGPICSILLNDGHGKFNHRLDYFLGSRHISDIQVGDLDGDGDLDIVAAGYQDDSVCVLLITPSV